METSGPENEFQKKLKKNLSENIADIKSAYIEKEKENLKLKKQLNSVRPALRKLIDDLKAAKAEAEIFRTQVIKGHSFNLNACIVDREEYLEHSYAQMRELSLRCSKLERDNEHLLEKIYKAERRTKVWQEKYFALLKNGVAQIPSEG